MVDDQINSGIKAGLRKGRRGRIPVERWENYDTRPGWITMNKSVTGERRKGRRFIKRCETEFSSNDTTYRGISSNLSLNGLCLKTNYPFPAGTMLKIVIHLPDGATAKIKGRVMWAKHTGNVFGRSVKALMSGMGIEIIERDDNFIHLVGSSSE